MRTVKEKNSGFKKKFHIPLRPYKITMKGKIKTLEIDLNSDIVIAKDSSSNPAIREYAVEGTNRAIKDLYIEELKLEYEKSIMSQWMNTIIDKWIVSKREHEFNKYWKITSVYIKMSGREHSYSPSFDDDSVSISFQGFNCRMWDDDESRSYFLSKDENLNVFNFNRYELVSEKGMIESLDFRLAKDLLQDKVENIIKDYDFDEYF